MAIENFAVGTLIIPMDATYQNNGMWRAYGLVYELLDNGIPVKWSIQSGKAFNGTDFTASATDFQSGAIITNHNYSGGPFIIDSAYAAAAAPFITAWQAANPNAKVHRATAPFSADIAATIGRSPRIAVEANNSGIVTAYLNAAGIPDSNGNTWSNSSPSVLSETEIAAGALFGYDLTACRRNAYDILLSPHTGSGVWDDPGLKVELNDWLYRGGFLHAMCESIPSVENEAGPFLTQTGLDDSDKNGGDTGTFTVTMPDFPTAQAVNTTNPQGTPGGSVETWLNANQNYNPQTQVIAHFTDNADQYDFMIAGPYKNGNGAGKIVYEGGHSYSISLPYTNSMENMYTRFVLNDIFFAVGKPLMYLQFTTPNPNNELFQGQPNTITFSVVNTGASPALSTGFSVTLAPGVVYNPGSATIPPTSIVGQTLTWSPASLGNVPPGTVLTFTANYTPPGVGPVQLATFSTSFGDENNEDYSLSNVCVRGTSVTQERPILNVVKTVDKAFATYGNTLNYTVTITNTGTVTATNVVFNDAIPANATFVPNSVTVAVPPGAPAPVPGANPNIGFPLPNIPPVPAPGSTVIVTFQVTVNNTATPEDVINQAEVDFQYTVDGTLYSGITLSNVVVTQVRIGELTLLKTTDKSLATIGDIITYTTAVINTGNATAFNVVFFDNPPAGTNFIPGTVIVNGVSQPGASPIAGVPIGDIPTGTPDSPSLVIVSFQVQVTSIPVPPTAINTSSANFLWRINPQDQPNIPGTGTSNPVTTQLLTPEITIVKSSDKAYVNIGDVITYTSVVTNTGDVTANSVVFTDNPPAGTTFVPGSVTVNGAPNPGNPSLGIPLGNMAPDASITVTFQVTATSVPVTNPTINIANASGQFTITPGEPPRTLDFDSNPVEVTIQRTGLSVVKSVDKAFAEVGEILTYTVVVTNTGTVPANNAVLTDIVPNGTTFIPGSVTINGAPSGVNPAAGIPLGNIPAGGSVTVTFQVTLTAIPVPNPAINTASVNANFPVDPQNPLNLSFQSNPASTRAEIAQVNVVKSSDKAFAEVGDVLTYTVTMTNVGTVPANGAVLTDIVPNGTAFIPGSVTINGIPSGSNPNSGIPVGNIPVGGSVTVTFKVTVTSIPVPNPAVNTATLRALYPVDPQNPVQKDFNSNPVTTRVETAQVDVVKTVDKAFAEVGDTLTYTSTITNTGTVPAKNILFTDVPPNGTSFIPGTLTVNGFQVAGNPAAGINLANIPVGGVTVVVFQVTVNTVPVPNPAENISVVAAVYPVDPQNPTPKTFKSNPADTQVVIAALDIQKSADRQFVQVGDTVIFTSVITNTGTVPATNVVFNDIPPAGTSFVLGSVTINGAPNAGNPSVGIPLPNIPAGGLVTVTFAVTINSVPVPNPTTNISTVDARFLIDPAQPPVPRNFVSNLVDIKVETAAVTVVKSADKTFTQVGEVVTYTVVMTNTGTVPANNAVLTDIVPSGTTFIPGSVTINGAPSGANPNAGIPVGNIPVGGSVTVTFRVTVTSIPTPNPTENIATLQAAFPVDPSRPPVIKDFDSNPVPLKVEIAEITAVKTVDKPFVEVGDTVTFTTTLTNTGTVAANNVVFTDNPPAGTTFIPGSVTINVAPSGSNPIAGIPVGNIPIGGSVVITFRVTIDAIPVPNPTQNIGAVEALFPIDPGKPPVLKDFETNPADIKVEIAQLDIVKTVDKAFAEVGDNLTYTITVTNTGTVAANSITITDPPPSGTSFVGGSVTVNGVPNATANPTTGINVGNIPAGGSATITFRVHVDFVPVPNPASNVSIVSGSFPVDPNNPVDKEFESNPADTKIEIARLGMVKSVDKPIVNVGDTVTYTTVITNTGTVPASNVVFTDTPPAGTTFVPNSVTINGLPVPLANPNTGINLGNIPVAGVDTVTFQVTVDSIPTPNPTNNISAVTGSFPVDPANLVQKDFESNLVPVKVELAKLEITKSTDKPFAEIGETVTYTVEVKNTGTVPAINVIFTDNPPAGTQFVPGSVTVNGIPTPGNPASGIPLPNISAGGTLIVAFKVTVVSVPTPNPSMNVAVVDAQFLIDPTKPPIDIGFPSNPVDQAIIKAQLDVVKSVDKTAALVGDTLTYTIVATNTGNVNSDNTVVYDLIPAGTIFVPNSLRINGISQPGVNPNNGVGLGTLTPGQSATITFDVTIASMPEPPEAVNSATAEFEYIVNPAQPPRSKTQQSNEVITRIEEVGLELVKSVDKNFVIRGDIITYTVEITNTGTLPVNNVIFKDPIPDGTVFVENSFAIGGVPVPGANPEDGVYIGTIAPGQKVTVSFSVRYEYRPCPPIIRNTAFAEFNFRIVSTGPVDVGTSESNTTETEASPTNFKQLSVDENLTIPVQKPDAEDILNTIVDVVILETRVIKTMVGTSIEGQVLTGNKLIIEGMLHQKVEYIANVPTQAVHTAEFNVPFSSFIILPVYFEEGTPITVTAYVEDVYIKLLDRRHLFKNVTLRLEADFVC